MVAYPQGTTWVGDDAVEGRTIATMGSKLTLCARAVPFVDLTYVCERCEGMAMGTLGFLEASTMTLPLNLC